MRKELASAVRAEFAVAIKRRLPQFSPIKVASRFAWPGSRVFRWNARRVVALLRGAVVRSQGRRRLCRRGRLVAARTLPGGPGAAGIPSGGGEATRPEHWSRLSSLYAPIGGFWSLEEPDDAPGATGLSGGTVSVGTVAPVPLEVARARVARRVEDAVDKLVAHGLPYFEQVAGSNATPTAARR